MKAGSVSASFTWVGGGFVWFLMVFGSNCAFVGPPPPLPQRPQFSDVASENRKKQSEGSTRGRRGDKRCARNSVRSWIVPPRTIRVYAAPPPSISVKHTLPTPSTALPCVSSRNNPSCAGGRRRDCPDHAVMCRATLVRTSSSPPSHLPCLQSPFACTHWQR